VLSLKALRLLSVGRLVTVADQGVSSASNLLLSVAIASASSATQYGVFALLYAVYWVLLGAVRASALEPLLITKYSGIQKLRPDLAALRLAVAVGTAAALLGLGLVLLGVLESAWVPLVLAFPILLAQDAFRYLCFLADRPKGALTLDGIWLAVTALGLVVVTVLGERGTTEVLIAWAGGAFVSVALGPRLAHLRRGSYSFREVARHLRPLSAPLLGEYAVNASATQLVIFLIPVLSASSLLGAFKAAQVANGPLNVVFAATDVVVLPLVARATSEGSARGILRISLATSVVLGGLAAAYGAVLFLLPEQVGQALFGESWGDGAGLAVVVSAQMALIGLTHGAVLALRGSGRGRTTFLIRVLTLPLNLVPTLWLTAVHGAGGLALGLLLTSALNFFLWWWRAVVSVRGKGDSA